MINENHEVMQTPYLCTLFCLTLIKGPRVDDWHQDQVKVLCEKVTYTNNPIGHDNPVLWTDFETAFTAAFTDTARVQNAAVALEQLKMKGDDIDTYTSTFQHLVNNAEYDITDPIVHNLHG